MTTSAGKSTAPEIDPDAYGWEDFLVVPDISHLVTEDDTPVDNLLQEKQQRFLAQCLYSAWTAEVPFLVAANVGLFYGLKLPALVPDVMLSLDVTVPEDWSQKEQRSYFVWEFGKPPDVAIEIVSNKKGDELGGKLQKYARAGVTYYAVFDPLKRLGEVVLQIYSLKEGNYHWLEGTWMEQVGLGLTLWEGVFEDKHYQWLRWCDRDGNVLLTGDEQAVQERQRAEAERQRAEAAEQQLAQAQRQAARLAELLRSQGINPDEVL
ncbi:MAG: Uma2 family endonuclease [Cyanothece sp. SIO1E1]|nr:Uma2 family endonuclease [Cyanothece sp. SIO1E1]